jgi:hypothetical protein
MTAHPWFALPVLLAVTPETKYPQDTVRVYRADARHGATGDLFVS